MVKIAFLTGCLEPGSDGVGDYARRLAAGLVLEGWESCLCAICDPCVEDNSKEEIQSGVTALRLAASSPARQRHAAVDNWLSAQQPDWISLQWVPFAFHLRGLPWQLSSLLRGLRQQGTRRHLMVHEPWMQPNRRSPWKESVHSILQRTLACRTLHNWRPHVVHTHIPVYQGMLTRAGFSAQPLPLFGNIPLEADPVAVSSRNAGQALSAGLFGNIYPDGDLHRLIRDLAQTLLPAARQLVVSHAGRLSPRALTRWESLADSAPPGTSFQRLGPLKSKELGRYLSGLDVGISGIPWNLVGKSGAICTMLESGLPVLVPTAAGDAGDPPGCFYSERIQKQLIPCPPGKAVFSEPGFSRTPPASFLADVVRSLMRDLTECKASIE